MIDVGDLVLVTDVMRSSTYTSVNYQQYGIILNVYINDTDILEGLEVLLSDQEVVYCFPEEIKVCSRLVNSV
jgi:hypothetical protein